MSTLVHIVMWRFTGESREARLVQAQQVAAQFLALRGQIEGLLDVRSGPNVAGEDWDLALYTEFINAAALAAYKAHPLHEAVVAKVKPMRAARAEVDFNWQAPG